MKNSFAPGIILLIVGLFTGYIIFGKVAGEYISILNLLGFKADFGHKILNVIIGIESIRINILLCGAGGFIAGFLLGTLGKKR
jgi:hypothetical protein